MISVIIPTIHGREHWLEKTLRAYAWTLDHFELILEYHQPTCTVGWLKGLNKASGDYVHFSSDDVEPHEGWWQAAILAISQHRLPCADLYMDGELWVSGDYQTPQEDGTETTIARMPFMPTYLAHTIKDSLMLNHYMSDYHIAWLAKKLGWPTVVVRKYVFTHHHAKEGRLETIDRDALDFYEVTDTTPETFERDYYG